jgi:hypothetical protein
MSAHMYTGTSVPCSSPRPRGSPGRRWPACAASRPRCGGSGAPTALSPPSGLPRPCCTTTPFSCKHLGILSLDLLCFLGSFRQKVSATAQLLCWATAIRCVIEAPEKGAARWLTAAGRGPAARSCPSPRSTRGPRSRAPASAASRWPPTLSAVPLGSPRAWACACRREESGTVCFTICGSEWELPASHLFFSLPPYAAKSKYISQLN